MAETDMLLMSAVIFVPAIFALGLLFFPRGTEEWMRWWSLLGTAVTLVVSVCLFIDYHKMLDFHMAKPDDSALLKRHDAAVANYYTVKENPQKTGVREDLDQLAR